MEDVNASFHSQFGGEPMSALVVGGSGGIGGELIAQLLQQPQVNVWATSRSGALPNRFQHEQRVQWRALDLAVESSIQQVVRDIDEQEDAPLRLVVVATGLLHDGEMQPEKRLLELKSEFLLRSFQVNSVGPMMVAQACIPKMPRKGRTVFASLGARVGSIEDNRLGGWYGYRASKAALNQFLKTLSIEWKRGARESIAVAFHPGTVNTPLSEPFQRNVPPEKLFDRPRAAKQLLSVLSGLKAEDTGTHVAWDGQRIPW